MKSITINPLINPLITLTVIGLGVFVFVTQKTILVPIFLAFFFSLLFLPGARRLERWRVPRIVANLLMIIFAILVLLGIGTALSFALSQFVGNLPDAQPAILQNLSLIQTWIAKTFSISLAEQQVWITENISLVEIGAQNIGSIISNVKTISSALALTFIYTFFLLYYRDKLKIFLQKLLGGVQEERVLDVIRKIGSIIPSYLTGVLWAMIILSALISLGLWIAGINNPLFWGIVIALLNIIPYIGTAVGFLLLVVFTLVTQGIPFAIGAIIVFSITQFIDNNFLTPLIAGGKIDINPMAAILGLIIIGSLWGTIGLVIALPIIGIIKVVADNLPGYHALGYLLGNEGTEDHALTWSNIKKTFTRRK